MQMSQLILSRVLLSCLLLFFLNACASKSDKRNSKIEFQGSTMGTQYHVTIVSPSISPPNKKTLKNNIDQILLGINQQMSTYIVDSEISKFNNTKNMKWFSISENLLEVVKAAMQVSASTGGAFDISVSPLVDLWGFGPDIKNKTPVEKKIEEVKRYIGFSLLEVQDSPPALRKKDSLLRLDVSAIAKGFAVDKISQYLNVQGLKNHLVEIGGEIRVHGFNNMEEKWRIAVEVPEFIKKTDYYTFELTNQAIATSGDYRNFYVDNGQRFSHIIDPASGEPVMDNLASVTVLHNSAMMADAYATALMVMGEERGKQFSKNHGLSVYMLIRGQGKITDWSTIYQAEKSSKRWGGVF